MVKKKHQSDSAENCEDSSGSNEEKQTKGCPHITKSVDVPKVRKYISTHGIGKVCSECEKSHVENDGEFEYDTSLWLCLKCGVHLCGRAKNGHAAKHFETPRSDSHALTVDIATSDVWCYACDNSVPSNGSKKLLEIVEFIRKTYYTNSQKIEATIQNVVGSLKPFLDTSEAPSVSTNGPVIENASVLAPTKVKGLTNLGNTCFFNAVMQCLAQTPFLVDVLQEMAEPGEKFTLPGGKLIIDGEEEYLAPISGELSAWGPLTQALHDTLLEMTSPGGINVTPRRLLSQLTAKMPQFGGGNQHDSHELLRHLLEAVRTEDVRRYHVLILKNLGLPKGVDPSTVDSDVKQRVKFYGNQAADRIMRPEQVFRGFLVSTLTCQECMHTSSRHEYFLDISLPVSTDKPQPPRRRTSPEPGFLVANNKDSNRELNLGPTKHQLKKEKKNARRGRKNKQRGSVDNSNNSTITEESAAVAESSSESDADVEDNLDDSKTPKQNNQNDPNGNSHISNESGYNSEKILSSDSIQTSPNIENGSKTGVGVDSGVASPENNTALYGNEVCELGISLQGSLNVLADLPLCTTPQNSSESLDEAEETPHTKVDNLMNELEKLAISENTINENTINQANDIMTAKSLKQEVNKMTQAKDAKQEGWDSTLAPRYNCEDMECSVQSCLNNFTALELMTGNNKVCCEACTERINGKDGKTITTNATKQFLISNPPAVLILHLKRFQVGPRCMFRKMTKQVSYPFILDIAPFCGAKVKELPNVSRNQTKLLYSLYGVVEHSGGMRGGHYVAYVKSRAPIKRSDRRWAFIPKGSKAELEKDIQAQADVLINNAKNLNHLNPDDDSSLSGYESGEGAVGGLEVQPPSGKWYCISDSHVREIPDETVLDRQAYLLFYERIL